MREAAAFANERCWGTLSCSVFAHPTTQARGRQQGSAHQLRQAAEQGQGWFGLGKEGHGLGRRCAGRSTCIALEPIAQSPCPAFFAVQRNHREAFDRLIEELQYGAIGVNGAAPRLRSGWQGAAGECLLEVPAIPGSQPALLARVAGPRRLPLLHLPLAAVPSLICFATTKLGWGAFPGSTPQVVALLRMVPAGTLLLASWSEVCFVACHDCPAGPPGWAA